MAAGRDLLQTHRTTGPIPPNLAPQWRPPS